jgi:hypothetical protein
VLVFLEVVVAVVPDARHSPYDAQGLPYVLIVPIEIPVPMTTILGSRVFLVAVPYLVDAASM